jgi:type II secretory pathway component GspD/PulD (secretin)
MPCLPTRPLLALLLCSALACPYTPSQTPSQTLTTKDELRAVVKPDPKRAKRLADLGARSEAAGDYEGALEAYEEAARYAPFDVTIVSKGATLRSRLVRGYVDEGERLALEGNLGAAAEAFAFALHADPTNAVLMERLKQIESMHQDEKEPADEPAAGMPKLDPAKATRSFDTRTDLRTAYEQVAAAYGIKAAFDPDLPARNVRFRVKDVDFETAMKILMLQTGTFWRPLNSKLMFVAADTSEKRKAFDMEMEQTFALPSTVDSSEMTELIRAVRELTGIQHIQQSIPSHTITIRDTVQKVKLAGNIIHQMDQARGEVLLEIDLLEVDRNNATKIGITPPSSARLITLDPGLSRQVRSAQSITALLTLLATIFGGPVGAAASSGVANLASAIPSFLVLGGGKTTFLLTLPGAAADFSQGLSLVQSGRQVLLRAQDGKPATFFVGDRYPVTLSLLSGSLGTANFAANPGGTGVTIPLEQFNVGQGPVSIVSSDFRSSGSLDLAVLNQIDNTLTILLNQGAGVTSQFADATNSPISLGPARTSNPLVPAALASASINATTNSFPGLLVTDPVANTVSVLTGNGDGTFNLLANPIAVGTQPSAIVTGTFNTNNGDGNPGFVVTNFKDNTYSVFNGNGDGTFTQATGSPFLLPDSVTGPIAMTVADFNADGFPDLAIVDQGTNQVTILEGNGDGTFKNFPGSSGAAGVLQSPITVGTLPVAIASGSLNGSTGPGLAIVNQNDNTLTVLLGNGDGTFTQSANSPLTTSTTPSGVVIGNFLEQANSGIAVTNTGSGTVTVYVDVGTGLIKALEPGAGTNPTGIVSGSFTDSTFPDLVVTNNISGAAGQVTLIVSPTSLISNPATNQQPYPGSEFIDLGLKVKATPSLHPNHEVTLQLDFDIKALAGNSINGIPVITSRTITQTVRLKEDETSLLTGLLDQQETKTITGLPGLAPLPGIGYAFGVRSNTFQDNELLILVTPRRVRQPLRESKTIYAGRGELTGGGGRGAFGGGAAPPPQPEAPPPGQGPPAFPGQQPQPAPVEPEPSPQQPQPEPEPEQQPQPPPQ